MLAVPLIDFNPSEKPVLCRAHCWKECFEKTISLQRVTLTVLSSTVYWESSWSGINGTSASIYSFILLRVRSALSKQCSRTTCVACHQKSQACTQLYVCTFSSGRNASRGLNTCCYACRWWWLLVQVRGKDSSSSRSPRLLSPLHRPLHSILKLESDRPLLLSHWWFAEPINWLGTRAHG